MKQRVIFKRIILLIVIAVLVLPSMASAQKNLKKIKGKKYKPCGIHLRSLSHTSGAPGDVIKMYGTWGATQGTKLPCINKGGSNRLIVLGWSNSTIKLKIPAGLTPGVYKVGAYCNSLSLGGSYSSGWLDFKVTGAGKKVDIDITDLYLDKKCRLWIKHTNRGIERLNVVLREKVWVNGRLIDNSTETLIIEPGRHFSHGVLADPGYIVSRSVRVKAQIDVDNILTETNERNNIMTKTIRCLRVLGPKEKLNLKKKTLKKTSLMKK